MELKELFNSCKITIWKEAFAIVKTNTTIPGAFATIVDQNETTVVIDQSKIENATPVIDIERDWKLITFNVVLPFNLVGFLAVISKALADENIPIFVISAFSTDHILVKNDQLAKATNKLKELGCMVG